jgi:hypothetical protein
MTESRYREIRDMDLTEFMKLSNYEFDEFIEYESVYHPSHEYATSIKFLDMLNKINEDKELIIR